MLKFNYLVLMEAVLVHLHVGFELKVKSSLHKSHFSLLFYGAVFKESLKENGGSFLLTGFRWGADWDQIRISNPSRNCK